MESSMMSFPSILEAIEVAFTTFFSSTPSASIVVLGIDDSTFAVDKEEDKESSPIESFPAWVFPLPNGKNPIFFTLNTARYFLSLHPPPICMKRFVLTLFFGVFCVYFECAQEKRALLLRVFVCRKFVFSLVQMCRDINF
jgi:hypothetical protein